MHNGKDAAEIYGRGNQNTGEKSIHLSGDGNNHPIHACIQEEFLRRYKEGLSPKQIVQELGYRVDILGARRVEGVRDHIVKESLSEAGLHEGTLHSKIKPISRDYTTLPESKAIEYM